MNENKRLTPEELAEIRKRAEAATNINRAGWCVDDEYSDTIRDAWDYELIAQCARGKETDAEFIAHAREDVPKLLAEIERLKTALDSIVMIGHVVTPSGQGRGLSIAIETARKTLEDGGYFDD